MSVTHNGVTQDVYVSIDRTPKQRSEHKKLVEQVKSKNSEDDGEWIIRNNRVVKNSRAPNRTSKIKWLELFKH